MMLDLELLTRNVTDDPQDEIGWDALADHLEEAGHRSAAVCREYLAFRRTRIDLRLNSERWPVTSFSVRNHYESRLVCCVMARKLLLPGLDPLLPPTWHTHLWDDLSVNIRRMFAFSELFCLGVLPNRERLLMLRRLKKVVRTESGVVDQSVWRFVAETLFRFKKPDSVMQDFIRRMVLDRKAHVSSYTWSDRLADFFCSLHRDACCWRLFAHLPSRGVWS